VATKSVARATTTALTAHLSPGGRVVLDVIAGGAACLPVKIADRIQAAFALGSGHGLLHLGAAELDTDLDPSLRYWRELGRQFKARDLVSFEGAPRTGGYFPTSSA
jgi:hypothetical protein